MAPPAMPAATFAKMLQEDVPYVSYLNCRLEKFERADVAVRLPYAPMLLRPGGTISGPAMMALADIVLYGTVLSIIGHVPLAVTTDMTIHFLKKPSPNDLIAYGRILKSGRLLMIGNVDIHDTSNDALVAQVTGTYAVPPARPASANGQTS